MICPIRQDKSILSAFRTALDELRGSTPEVVRVQNLWTRNEMQSIDDPMSSDIQARWWWTG